MDDAGLIAFATVIVTLVLGLATLYVQNRRQNRKLGEPNGGGSLSGDVHQITEQVHALALTVGLHHAAINTKVDELAGEMREHNRATDERLDHLAHSATSTAEATASIDAKLEAAES